MRVARHLLLTVIFGGMFFSVQAKAISPENFDKLSCADRDRYMDMLVQIGQAGLKEHQKPDDALKLFQYFLDNTEDGGMAAFQSNLSILLAVNKSNLADPSHTTPPYQIEHAFALTSKEHGIQVPVAYLLQSSTSFQPSIEPKVHVLARPPDLKKENPTVQEYEQHLRYYAANGELRKQKSQDDSCIADERLESIEGQQHKLHTKTIPLSGNRTAFLKKDGTFVEGNGTPLRGLDLETAKEYRTAHPEIASFEDEQDLKRQKTEMVALKLTIAKFEDDNRLNLQDTINQLHESENSHK